jgi:radical SAM protein (TIGR01212 family)
MLTEQAPVNSLGRHLKRTRGRRLRRVMLDLGLTCPNRDGVQGRGGCIYCDVSGSGTGAMKARIPLEEQWAEGLQRAQRGVKEGPSAIVYFQSYSSTYPSLLPLQQGLETAKQWADDAPIVAIGTRPDCFTPEAAALMASAKDTFEEVWLELGFETADDAVQKRIERFDTLENFHKACALAHEYGLSIVAHCIDGLPGEKPGGLLRQMNEIKKAGVHGVKFHQLMVLRKTKLAAQWIQGDIELQAAADYIQHVADALEVLPQEIVIHRLAAEASPGELLAPQEWPSYKQLHGAIENEMRRRGRVQGARA